MSRRSDFQKAKYFCGLIFPQGAPVEKAIAGLVGLLSPLDTRSALFPFTQTPYYRAEMGEPLFRQFVSFAGLLEPGELPRLKLAAMKLEDDLAVAGKRTVNIDPGYFSEANVIIATAKNHYHRVPLADGVYAHMEYVWKDGRIQFLPWTYPDFKTEAYLEFFNGLRAALRLARRAGGDGISG